MTAVEPSLAPPTAGAGLLRRVYVEQLPGLWGRRLEVPLGQQAVGWKPSQVTLLRGGQRYRLGGPGGLPRPEQVLFFPLGPLILHPHVDGLLARDGTALQASFLLTLRVADARRLAPVLGPVAELPEVAVESRARQAALPFLQARAREHASADLCGDGALSSAIASDLRGLLAAALEPLGLELQGVRFLCFIHLEDALRLAQARQEALRQARGAVDDEDPAGAVKEALAQIESRYQLSPGEKEALAQEAVAEAAGRGPLRPSEARAAALIDVRLRELDYREEAPPKEPNGLRALVIILRVLGYSALAAIAALGIFRRDLLPDEVTVERISYLVSFLLAITALISSVWLDRKLQVRRAEARVERQKAGLSAERRQAAERLMRAQMAGALEETRRHLDEAWNRAYRAGQQELATRVRLLAKQVPDLQAELDGTATGPAPLLVRPDPAVPLLEAWVHGDKGLLLQLQERAGLVQQLFSAVVDGRWAEVEEKARLVEKAFQETRAGLVQRETLLQRAGG